MRIKKKIINKRQGKADIEALAEQLESEALSAPNKPTQNFYKRMARDIRVALQVHFSTTK